MRFKMKRVISVAIMLAMLFSSSVILGADASTVAKKEGYWIYSYDDFSQSYYELSLEPQYSASSRAVIFGDDRKRDGYSGIVRLSGIFTGSGFIVGDHIIATAAHCTYVKYLDKELIKEAYKDTNYYVDDLQIHLYNDNGTPKNTVPLTPVEIHISADYIEGGNYSDDYALIYVDEDLSEYGCAQFNLGIPYEPNNSSLLNHDLFVSGIPSKLGEPNEELPNSQRYVYTGKGSVFISDKPVTGALDYTCDTSNGTSGGPVYTAYQYTIGSTTYTSYTAIAVHSSGKYNDHNGGAAMNSERIQFYRNNDYIGW